MRRWQLYMSIMILSFTAAPGLAVANSGHVSAAPPALQAEGAVLMDETTGQVLYAKNPIEHLYPASITKIMTALLALQHGHLTDRILTSPYAASQEPKKVYLVPGEVESLQQMLYGLLIDSGNDAAVAIAEHYGGSVHGFAAMMNAEARRLGADNTHFVNPNGLHDPNHYTSAYDMALIARAAMAIPEFRKIVDTKYYLWRGKEWTSNLSNLNDLLWWYNGANGVKTGYTDQAEQTIVETATRGNRSLLVVLMHVNGQQEVQQETAALLDYGFAQYQTGQLVTPHTLGTVYFRGEKTALQLSASVTAMWPKGFPAPDEQALSLSRPLRIARTSSTLTWHSVAPSDAQTLTFAAPVLDQMQVHLAYGLRAGARIGYATVGFDGAHWTIPVTLAHSLPVPVVRKPVRPPVLFSFVLAGLCLLPWLLVRRRQRVKQNRYAGRRDAITHW